MKLSRENLLLYAVTDSTCIGKRDFYETIELALKGGVTMVQLREKDLNEEELINKAVKVKHICERFDVPLIINDNYRAAIKAGADGVHVGISDTPVAEIRRIAGDDFIIGATAKTCEQALKARADGADYLGVGAVFPSPTKKNAIRITKEQLREITSAVDIPVAAIGGISRDNILELSGCGIDGVALVSAIFAGKDIERECMELKMLAEKL